MPPCRQGTTVAGGYPDLDAIDEVDDLTRTCDEVEAVRDVSCTAARGKVFGFLSPNGAGTARVSGFDVPVGQPVRPPVFGATPSATDVSRRAAELAATQFDTVAAAAEEYDAPVATSVMLAGVCR